MGYLDLKDGKNESALAHFRASDEPFRLTGTAMLEHTLGHAPESEQALDPLKTKYAAGSAFQIAAVYAWRGEKDLAFEWLDRAYDQHDAGMPRLRYDPTLASLHDDSRFAALVKRMGFCGVNPRNFFAELKRRNVYKVAIAYAVVGWLLIQIATSTFPVLEIPNWAIKLVIALVATRPSARL